MSWTAPLRPLFRAGEGLVDRVLCLLGAVAFCQLPEFIQQYLQRLGGRLDEARLQVAKFEEIARQSSLTLSQFIERTSATPDAAVAKLGGLMREAVQRVESLAAAENAIRSASAWEKPFAFFAHLDRAIASATLEVYKPAVPATVEGACYALAGMVVMLGIYHGLIRRPVSAAIRARRTKDSAKKTPPRDS